MLPRNSRHTPRAQRALRRIGFTTLERLEERQLLSFSDLGFSLPDLIVSGVAGPKAAWGGTISVAGYVQNIGASTIPEPTQQVPTSQLISPALIPNALLGTNNSSTADAPDTSVAVYITPHRNSMRGGDFAIQ